MTDALIDIAVALAWLAIGVLTLLGQALLVRAGFVESRVAEDLRQAGRADFGIAVMVLLWPVFWLIAAMTLVYVAVARLAQPALAVLGRLYRRLAEGSRR